MNIEFIKGIFGILKPEFIADFSLNKKIEYLNNHINYLNNLNRNTKPFEDKLEDVTYQANFGLVKDKYEFFYSHDDILSHFQHLHLKTLSMFTYRDKNNQIVVSMTKTDIILCLIFCFYGIIAIGLLLVTFIKFKPFNVFDLSELMKNKVSVILLLTLPFCIGYIFIKFFAPFFLIPKFNKLYTKNK